MRFNFYKNRLIFFLDVIFDFYEFFFIFLIIKFDDISSFKINYLNLNYLVFFSSLIRFILLLYYYYRGFPRLISREINFVRMNIKLYYINVYK